MWIALLYRNLPHWGEGRGLLCDILPNVFNRILAFDCCIGVVVVLSLLPDCLYSTYFQVLGRFGVLVFRRILELEADFNWKWILHERLSTQGSLFVFRLISFAGFRRKWCGLWGFRPRCPTTKMWRRSWTWILVRGYSTSTTRTDRCPCSSSILEWRKKKLSSASSSWTRFAMRRYVCYVIWQTVLFYLVMLQSVLILWFIELKIGWNMTWPNTQHVISMNEWIKINWC